jgi:hypothetical protein
MINWSNLIGNIASVLGLCGAAYHFGGWIGLCGALCFCGFIETCTHPDRYRLRP